ncbi:MAG: hypothetical protein IJ662_04990 [Clostridia bacterium]|nr:hypothetical protein [Clostridia bacterium]
MTRNGHKQGWMILLFLFLLLFSLAGAAQAEGAQVTGVVYYDRNNNGKQDANETGVNGAKVILEQYASGDNKEIASKSIDKNGDFAFAVGKSGQYRLRVELPKEYNFTLFGSGSAALPAQGTKSVTPYFDLSDGDALTKDIGASRSSAALSLVSFVDTNANGGRSSAEPLLKGVEAELLYTYDGKTHVAAKSTSDRNGTLSMRDLAPGTYTLRVTLPENYVIGPKGEKDNTWYNRINAGEEGMGVSDPFTIDAGHTFSMGIGAVKTGSLTGTLWYDDNYNGKKDSGEKGLTDATVYLISDALNLTRETKPDSKGAYAFKGLQPGKYKIGVQLSDGLVFTYPGDSLITVIGAYGEADVKVEEEKTTQVQLIGAMPAAQVTLHFYVDDNLNGTADNGESPLAGVSVTVSQNGQKVDGKKTDRSGAVTFSALRSGTVDVSAQLPDGYIYLPNSGDLFSSPDVTASHSASIPVGDQNGNAFDGAVAVTVPAVIRGKLFEDPQNTGLYTEDCDPLAGFTAQAVSADGQILAQAVTDATGEYTLYPLPAGQYTVRFLLDDAYVASPHTDDNAIVNQTPAYGETAALTLGPNQEAAGVDGAVFRAGVVDGYIRNEEGKKGLRDITVTLLNGAGEPVSDFSYGVTDEEGHYVIKGVLPGAYSLRYSLPVTAALTVPATDAKELTSEPFTVVSGTEIHLQDLTGVYTANLSGFVGLDAKHPLDAQIALTAKATGDTLTVETKKGAYAFEGLRPGSYTLQVTLPEGYVFAKAEGSPLGPKAGNVDSASVSLKAEDQKTLDVHAAVPVDLYGVVFYDANQNGAQDDGEGAVADRGLTLYMGDDLIGPLTTDENGEFSATHLVPGDYALRLSIKENEALVGVDAKEADSERVIALPLNEDTVLTLPLMQYATVTGAVWNLDGTTNNVKGIAVTLRDQNGNALAKATTNSKGNFTFTKLLPGKYSLSAVLPDGYLFARKQDTASRSSYIQSQDNGGSTSVAFSVAMGKQVTGIDIGIGAMGKIGDKAWLDEDGNGMQDINEPGMPGIEIKLYRDGELVASATTDLYGRYSLDNLYPGEYEMRVTMHKELKTTKQQTKFPLVASILPESTKTTVKTTVTVPSGGQNLHCDLGFQLRKKGTYPKIMDQIPTKNWKPYSER